MIKLEGISKTYQAEKVETLALKNINLHVKKGEFLSIMGPSGCGKSTLLNVIGLLDQPGSGNISVDNVPVKSYRDKDVARLRNQTFGFIFQSFALLSVDRAVGNITHQTLLHVELVAKARAQLFQRRHLGGATRLIVGAVLCPPLGERV